MEDAEASESSEGSLARGAKRAWPAATMEGNRHSMAELRAKAEAELLKASANMANFRASANKTGKQCVAASPCDVRTPRLYRCFCRDFKSGLIVERLQADVSMCGRRPAVPDSVLCCEQGVQASGEGWHHAEGPLQEGEQGCWQGSSIGALDEQTLQTF